ncbi:MAG: HAD family hydrolase [Oscillochloris sp.]|nr:HAD family hydrolase [Oscillochloris sp.]
MPPFLGVILDVDGTLVDSNDAHARAWCDAFAEQGLAVEYTKVRRLIGMGSDQLLPEAADIQRESELGSRLAERRGEVFTQRYLAGVAAFPQTRALVERLRDQGLKLVVASSAKASELEPLLQRAQVADLLPMRTSSGDVEHSKPAPDAVQAALESCHLPATAAVMIGDTPYDIAAATQAGVDVIAFRCGGWGDADLAGAIAIYDDPADLLANYHASPLAVTG